MLYILEGCDGAGKTTLAKTLSQILNAQIIHCSTQTPNNFEFFDDIARAAMDKNIIADRFCYGQFVYQSKEDRHLSEHDLYTLETRMLDYGVTVIYVYTDEKTLMDRLIYRGETTALPISTILSNYKEVFEKSLIKPILWKT